MRCLREDPSTFFIPLLHFGLILIMYVIISNCFQLIIFFCCCHIGSFFRKYIFFGKFFLLIFLKFIFFLPFAKESNSFHFFAKVFSFIFRFFPFFLLTVENNDQYVMGRRRRRAFRHHCPSSTKTLKN